MRHLRVRAGSTTTRTCSRNSIEILREQRIVLDHISASWAVDENVSAWEGNAGGPSNITVQWSIISEGLQNSSHQSGAHSTGSLFGLSVRNVTVRHNLFAHNGERNPKFNMSGGVADVVNNLIYNWGDWGGTSISTDFGNYPTNLQANFYKRGPSTPGLTEAPYFEIGTGESEHGVTSCQGLAQRQHRPPAAEQQPAARCQRTGRLRHVLLAIQRAASDRAERIRRQQSGAQQGGATKPQRNAVDKRIISNVQNRLTGLVVDGPSQVGGYPSLATGTPTNSDLDGMPNTFETANGLNPNNPANRNGDLDGDG